MCVKQIDKLVIPFLSTLFNGMKIVTVFKCIFEETVPKLSVNFGNHISQDSHKNHFFIILLQRVKDEVDVKMTENQAGFRKGRSCQDQIFNLNQIIEKCLDQQLPCLLNLSTLRLLSNKKTEIMSIGRASAVSQRLQSCRPPW